MMVSKLNIYSIKATYKEYIDFCTEFMGLYGVAIDICKDNLEIYNQYCKSSKCNPPASSESIGKLEVLYSGNFFLEFKDQLPPIVEFRKMMESIKNEYINSHKGEMDLGCFHRSPIVVGFKKRLFTGLREEIKFDFIDWLIDSIDIIFPKFVLRNCIENEFAFWPRVPVREGGTTPFVLDGLEFTYKFSRYFRIIDRNLIFKYTPFSTKGVGSGSVLGYKSDFRFIPEKMNYFYQIINNVLIVPEHKDFTLKDKYKWLYYFIDSVFLIGRIHNSDDSVLIRDSVRRLICVQLVTREAQEILMSNGGFAYFNWEVYSKYEYFDYKLDNGIELSEEDEIGLFNCRKKYYY